MSKFWHDIISFECILCLNEGEVRMTQTEDELNRNCGKTREECQNQALVDQVMIYRAIDLRME